MSWSYEMKWNDMKSKEWITLVRREFALLNRTFHRQSQFWYRYQLLCRPTRPARSYWAGQQKLVHKLTERHRKLLHISCCDLCVIWRLWCCYGPISHSVESMRELWCSSKACLGYILKKIKHFRVQEKLKRGERSSS